MRRTPSEYYRDWAECEQWHRRQQDRLRRDRDEANNGSKGNKTDFIVTGMQQSASDEMLKMQKLQHSCAELDAVLHASLVGAGGAAEAAAAAEAEMVQDALRAADEAEEASRVEALRATLATIAALKAADEAAAPAEAAAEAAAAEAACLICLEIRACTVRLKCCGKKMCLQCYTQVQKCPYCRADFSRH